MHACSARTSAFRNSLIDNEPDWINEHPWGLRPNRILSKKRLWWLFSAPYHFIRPLDLKTTYKARQKYHEVSYLARYIAS
jgi:hypothetical protein